MYYFIVFQGIIIIKSTLNSAFQGEKNNGEKCFKWKIKSCKEPHMTGTKPFGSS